LRNRLLRLLQPNAAGGASVEAADPAAGVP
jgi:hypothetical protein